MIDHMTLIPPHELERLLDHLKEVRQKYAGLNLKAEHDENLRIAVDVRDILTSQGYPVMPDLLKSYIPTSGRKSQSEVQPLAGQAFTDCRTDEGTTVGLIDAIITISRVLRPRNTSSHAAQEALKDLAHDEDFTNLLWACGLYAPPEGKTP
jgi:hypothetical protein